MLVVNNRLSVPLREFEFTFARSSGPGGQNVNKVNTKATLRWPVTTTPSLPEEMRKRFVSKYHRRITADGDLILTSQRFRDQGRNVADCLSKLRDMLESVVAPPKKRQPTRPSRASKERRLKEKREKSQKKQRRGGKIPNE
jgi:ribosome-associated protein